VQWYYCSLSVLNNGAVTTEVTELIKILITSKEKTSMVELPVTK